MIEQLSIDYARRLGEEGQQRALDRAESDIPAWGELALQWLRRYAETHAQFPGWFVTEEAGRDVNFPSPANTRAWGSVWVRAQRLGIIKDSGRSMPHPRRHASKAIVWSSLIYRT